MRNHEWRRIPSSVGDGLPALDVLWSYRRRPVTDLNLVKAARAAMIWRRVAWHAFGSRSLRSGDGDR